MANCHRAETLGAKQIGKRLAAEVAKRSSILMMQNQIKQFLQDCNNGAASVGDQSSSQCRVAATGGCKASGEEEDESSVSSGLPPEIF